MVTIAVNLADVETFDNLPTGEYLGQIDRIQYREPKEAGKFGQLQVTFVVTDDEGHLGRKQSEWVSLSPKAAFRMKRWMAKFGYGDLPELDIDDATNDLLEPNLIGIEVIFTVAPDGDRVRTELKSVEDDMSATHEPEVLPTPAPEAAPEVLVEAPVKEVAAPVTAAPAKRPAPQRRTLR